MDGTSEARGEASIRRLPAIQCLLSTKWRCSGRKIQRAPQMAGKKSNDSCPGIAFRAALLGNTPRDHIELRPSPEKRPAHADCIAIGDATGAIVSPCLLENVDRCLPGEQRYI
jgi:hypothetical protein